MTVKTRPGAPDTTVSGALGLPQNPSQNPFGLTRHELRAEIRRLSDLGWMTWELRTRFGASPRALEHG